MPAKPAAEASPEAPKALVARRSRAVAITRVSVKGRRVVTTRVRVGAAGRLQLLLTRRGITWKAFMKQRSAELKGLEGAERRRAVASLRRQWKVRNAIAIPVGSARLALPITVTLTSRALRRLAPGRYVLKARLAPEKGRRAEARRTIRIR